MPPFMGNELLQGEVVYLAKTESPDVQTLDTWFADMLYQRMLRRGQVYPGDARHAEWFKSVLEKHEGFPFLIRRRDNDHLVGYVMINNIFWQARHCTLILAIDPQQGGRGYGTDAMRVLLRYAFMEMNLNRVGLEVMAYNEAAIAVYEKVGFIREGTLRQFVYRDGVYYDIYTMSILRAEWEMQPHAAPPTP